MKFIQRVLFLLILSIQTLIAKDSLFVLINPNQCLSILPSYSFINKEIKEKRDIEVVFLLCKIRKSQAKSYIQNLFQTKVEDLNVVVNDSLFFALGQTFLSGIYDPQSKKYYHSFDSYLETTYTVVDTIYVDETRHLGSPYLKLNKYGGLFLVETKEKLIAKCDYNGKISHVVNINDSIWSIRVKASLTGATDIQKINLQEKKDSVIIGLNKDKTYPNLLSIKVGSQFLSGPSINLLTQQYEVKDAENVATNEKIELIRSTYLVQLDTLTLSVQKAWKIQLPRDSVDINMNSFFFTSDSTLIVPLQPYFDGADKDFPSLAIFKVVDDKMVFQMFATNGLPDFTINSGYLHGFFSPKFIESANEIYYFENTTMCFYKLNSPQYELCLPGFTENTLEAIFKYFRTTGDLAETWESDNTLNAITFSYDMNNLSQAHQKLFVLDLKNKTILEEIDMGIVGTKQTNNPKYFKGYTYKLVISDDDKLLIIKEPFNP